VTAADIAEVMMSIEEEARRAELEAVIKRGLASFVEVGTALAEIAESQLYRATHATFADYALAEFGLSPSYAWRKIAAAKVAEAVSPIGDRLANEAQARELSGLDADQAAQAIGEAKRTGNGKVTASGLREARRSLFPIPSTPQHGPGATQDRLGADQDHGDDLDADEFDQADASSDLTDAMVELQDEQRRLVHADRFAADVRAEMAQAAADIRSVVESMRRRREAVDPLGPLIAEIASSNPQYSAEVIYQDVNQVILRSQNYRLDLKSVRSRLSGKYGKPARAAKDRLVIEVGPNTALLLEGEVWAVRNALKTLGTDSMRDRKTKLWSFSSKYADDLQAALELIGKQVELRRVDVQ
jgi:hypothetical protein